MRKLVMITMLVCMLVGNSGCAKTIEGLPQITPYCDKLPGFEELAPDDPECGKTVSSRYGVFNISTRYAEIGDKGVLYMIIDMPFGVDPRQLAEDPRYDVRPYEHVVVYNVTRYSDMDIVSIYASDTCSVETKYINPITQFDCVSVVTGFPTDMGRKLDENEVKTILSQRAIDDIDARAYGSGRTPVYSLTVVKAQDP